jgi:hypothetical protein
MRYYLAIGRIQRGCHTAQNSSKAPAELVRATEYFPRQQVEGTGTA